MYNPTQAAGAAVHHPTCVPPSSPRPSRASPISCRTPRVPLPHMPQRINWQRSEHASTRSSGRRNGWQGSSLRCTASTRATHVRPSQKRRGRRPRVPGRRWPTSRGASRMCFRHKSSSMYTLQRKKDRLADSRVQPGPPVCPPAELACDCGQDAHHGAADRVWKAAARPPED
jgi:hypothetical protein